MNAFKCVCCSKEIKRLYQEDEQGQDKPWEGMWDGGIVERVGAGYGSLLDGDIFVIAVCDACADQKTKDGTMLWVGNYMAKAMKTYKPLK